MKRVGFGCIGFVATFMVGMFISLAVLDATGHYKLEDAQIPVFPALVVFPLASVAAYLASRPLESSMQVKDRVLLRLSVVRCLLGWLFVTVLLGLVTLFGKYLRGFEGNSSGLMWLGVFGLTVCSVPLALHYAITRCAVFRVRNGRVEAVGLFGHVGKGRSKPLAARALGAEVVLKGRAVTPTQGTFRNPDRKDLKISANGGDGVVFVRLDSAFLPKATRERLKSGEHIVISVAEP